MSAKEVKKHKYLLNFLPDVSADVNDAYDWYEKQIAGLGEQFLTAIDASINRIEREPKSFQKIYLNVRKCNAKRFPFGIFFTTNKNIITVIAIVHLARHPKTWKKRRK